MTNFWKKFTAASLLILFVNFNALAQEGELIANFDFVPLADVCPI